MDYRIWRENRTGNIRFVVKNEVLTLSNVID